MGSAAIMVHHLVATMSLVGALVTGQGHGYTLLLLATELTTPFINARWQLDALVRVPPIFPEAPISGGGLHSWRSPIYLHGKASV